MILHSLAEYYDALAARGEIVRPGWSNERVSFAINLSADGELRNIVPTKVQATRGKKTVDVPVVLTLPERVVRSSGVRSNFLCESVNYLLGFDIKGDPKRALECYEACKTLHLSVLEGAHGASANAIKSFFNNWEPEKAADHPILLPYKDDLAAANIVIMVETVYAHTDQEIIACWDAYRESQSASAVNALCLVTGKHAPAAVVHGKIKGIPGGQSSGMTLVGFNARAYESYGKEDAQGLNAPVSERAAFAYTTALNRLLADREHSRRVGDASVVYWAKNGDPKAQQAFSWLMNPPVNVDAELDGIMKNLAAGNPVMDIDMKQPFYVLGLAPNAARVAVRFFLRDSFGNMLGHIMRHYQRLEIVRPAFDKRRYLAVSDLLYQTVNPNARSKDASPLLSGAVMRAMLTGGMYPMSLYNAILGRIRAEREVSADRAAIIKAVLIRNFDEEEVTSVALNETSDNRAYVLGRLFAVLEDAQGQAIQGINTTIRDKYLTSACATPGSVFPQLLKLSAYHTAKLDDGKRIHLERQKTELLGKLDIENRPFPMHHSLQEQGIFILGYYHQVQYRYTKKTPVPEKDSKVNLQLAGDITLNDEGGQVKWQ